METIAHRIVRSSVKDVHRSMSTVRLAWIIVLGPFVKVQYILHNPVCLIEVYSKLLYSLLCIDLF